jgi:hypothetical protein
MRVDELTHPRWGDGEDYCRERDMKDGKTDLIFPAIVQPQSDMTAATPSLSRFGELKQTSDIVPGKLQMPQGTFEQEVVRGSGVQRIHRHKQVEYLACLIWWPIHY